MITKKTKYGLRALIYLAKQYQQGNVLISTIAEKEHIPLKFLEAILLDLRKIGILGSRKGKGGGYYLLKAPSEVNLEEIIRYLNGPISLVSCVSLRFYETCEECPDENICAFHKVALEVRDKTLEIFKNHSLETLVNMELGN